MPKLRAMMYELIAFGLSSTIVAFTHSRSAAVRTRGQLVLPGAWIYTADRK